MENAAEKKTFGERLKALRKEKNLKQSELGELFDLSPSAIGSYERDLREPAYHHLTAFADYFNTSVDFLLCRTDERLTVDNYRSTDEYEYLDMLNKFKITLHGYELSETDKRRLLDIAVGLFWTKFTEEEPRKAQN